MKAIRTDLLNWKSSDSVEIDFKGKTRLIKNCFKDCYRETLVLDDSFAPIALVVIVKIVDSIYSEIILPKKWNVPDLPSP